MWLINFVVALCSLVHFPFIPCIFFHICVRTLKGLRWGLYSSVLPPPCPLLGHKMITMNHDDHNHDDNGNNSKNNKDRSKSVTKCLGCSVANPCLRSPLQDSRQSRRSITATDLSPRPPAGDPSTRLGLTTCHGCVYIYKEWIWSLDKFNATEVIGFYRR